MARFRKKPVVIEATQWFMSGDHPDDGCVPFTKPDGETAITEGKVVRYCRRPETSGERRCQHCSDPMHNHGWIDTPEGGHIVCPGDWVITGVAGERYPCKPDIFEATYDLADEAAVRRSLRTQRFARTSTAAGS